MTKDIRLLHTSLILVLSMAMLVNIRSIQDKVYLNMVTLSTTLNDSGWNILSPIRIMDIGEKTGTCHIFWYLGFIMNSLEKIQERDSLWGKAVVCDPDLVYYLHNQYSDDLELAVFIHRVQPAAAESWFWLGDLTPKNRLDYYMHGLTLDPTDGRRWHELGVMFARQGDFNTALQAFLQSCYNGDPGHNGCWRAGGTAEQLGDIESAIKYYKLSRWGTALDRANELEDQ